MDNNNQFTYGLQGLMHHLQTITKSMETGDGMGLTNEQKEEYQKQMKEKGGEEKVCELKKQMEKLKETVNKANNGKPN